MWVDTDLATDISSGGYGIRTSYHPYTASAVCH